MGAQTPSQTIGPFFHGALVRGEENVLAGRETPGTRIRLEGRVVDGRGDPVNDALLEIWQADSRGRYRHPADCGEKLDAGERFTGFGRVATDAGGAYRFFTIKPGPVSAPGGSPQAPHLCVTVFARGLLSHLYTRVYFPDEAGNARDAVLSGVDPRRRQTLVAQRSADAGGAAVYRFDIALQGAAETVFFDL